MAERVLPFEGIANFRDHGGYAVAAGGYLREAWLYRSGHHCDATADDLRAFGTLGIGAVIDLRGPGERLKAPSLRPRGFGARIYEPDSESGAVAPHIEVAVKGVTNAAEARAATEAVYADMPFRPAFTAALRLYFAALADVDAPSVIHCSAGKDRTGLAVALLHRAMGVHPDDTMADYLLTNTGAGAQEWIAASVAAVRRNFGPGLSEETVRTLAGEPSFLGAAFAAIDNRCGSCDAYLRAEIGLDATHRDRLVRRLIV